MAIQQGDIKIMASQVLADVAEGGGAATGNEIVDGVSNNLFPDISELDRTIGRVNLRKVFPAVRTATVDGYYGVNVIVSDAPDDPAVSAVLFNTQAYFDTRDDAQSRIESYLTRGTQYGGLLFGDHVAGMRTLTILQRAKVVVPTIGTTLLLRANAGTANEHSQYVRVTQVTSRVREFAIPNSTNDETFKRVEVTAELSDPLREDYNGFPPIESYNDSNPNFTGKTQIFETVVADAAQYFGITPLASAIALGDFSANVDSIFSQIVPSAQVEAAIADARMNQQSAALVSSGAAVSQSITLAFTISQAMYVGGSIMPGTLQVVREGVTLTDKGGNLMRDTDQVGSVDYENGILTLSTNVWGASGTHAVTYKPSAALTVVTRSIGVPVTQQSQSLSAVVSLNPVPAPGSLQISYLSGGRWYVLGETGTGSIVGSESSIGAGTLNFDTGTVALTMGALPDIGSQIIYSWAPVADRRTVSATAIDNGGRAYMELALGALTPGSLTLTWNDGQPRSATDNAGQLQGDATGRVWYGGGRVQFSPASLPAKNTEISWAITSATKEERAATSLTDSGSSWTWTLPNAPIKARSLRLAVAGSIPERKYPGVDATVTALRQVQDDGAGNLFVTHMTGNLQVGSINYATGLVTLAKSSAGYVSSQGNWQSHVPYGGTANDPAYVVFTGATNRTTALTLHGDFAAVASTTASWAWWGAYAGEGAFAQYAGASGAVASGVVVMSQLRAEISTYGGSYGAGEWSSADFYVGASQYRGLRGTVIKDINPATGEGEYVGYLTGSTASISAWPTGASSLLGNVRGSVSPPSLATNRDTLTDGVIFRTAQSPIKPSSFSVTGALEDGTTFNASADADGNIISSVVKGKINVEAGVVVLRFGAATAAPSDPLNPGVGKISLAYLGIPGVEWVDGKSVQADTLRYNAVAYSYIPLDADILGLDPVRLPSDGRVPIFRPGSVAVVHNTQLTSPATVSAGQTINVARTRLSRVRVLGANGAVINTGYSANLDAGTVTFTNTAGYSQPVRIEHRIEDTALVSSAQITGRLQFTRAISHAYPADTSFVSSALVVGDMQARISSVFDQSSWTNAWSDDLIGDMANATFNDIDYPITTTNLGAVTERFVIRFTGATAFTCYGEHLGLIGTGNTSQDFSPNNPAADQPYFTIPALGWGGGWSAGNVLRLNTIGAIAPVWVARVIKQSQPTETADSFSLLVRGDIDNV